MTSRSVVPLDGLPSRVTVYEVGARDGLQNEPTIVPVAVKAEFIRRLSATGLSVVEATSLVRPDRVPALADAEELIGLLDLSGPVRHPVLVPNERGLDRALSLGVQEICVFASATETFARNNLGRGLDDSLAMFAPVVARAKAAGLRVRAYLSMCWVDPWEGPVDPSAVVSIAARLLEMGSDELSLGDTIGAATPGAVDRLLSMLRVEGIGPDGVAVHFHDTYGQALANTLTALRAGITTVDSSAGGLGGCPFAKSATGNLATEDLVWMLEGLGIETGVDLEALVRCSVWMAAQLGRPSPSAVVRALAAELGERTMADLLVAERGGVLRLTIDRPDKRNALSDEVATGICDALAAVGDDVRVVLLASTGDKVFCAGADLAVMASDGAHENRGGVRRVVDAMRVCPVPVVVRVQGLCLAGGVGLVLGSDVAIAARSAQFGLPEVNLGLWPFMVSVLLAQHVSPKAALELMLSGRRVGAAEAAALGMLSRVVPDDVLDDEVETAVTALAALAPLAVREGKRTFWRLVDAGAGEAMTEMQAELSALSGTADAAEGIAAFRERRAPHWQGR